MKNLIIIMVFLIILVAGNTLAAGTDFDCKTLGISVDRCYNQDGVFGAELVIKGTLLPESHGKIIDSIMGIDYTLDTDGKYKTVDGDIVARGGLPENYKLKNTVGDKYVLEADMGNNIVKSLRVAYTKDDYYKYTHEMEYCWLVSGDYGIKMYGFKMCEELASSKPAEENKVTALVVKEEVSEASAEGSDNLLYIIIGAAIVLVIIIAVVVLKKRK